MLKYLLIAGALLALWLWWLGERRRAVRARLRREAENPRLAEPLTRCPHCGTYKVKGARCCDKTGVARG